MDLARLRGMGVAEIADRSRQQALGWYERARAGATTGRGPPRGPAPRLDPTGFFVGATDAATPALAGQRAPEAGRAVIDAADRSKAGRFDLLGYRDLAFGSPVDWHLDPVSGVRAPPVHWTQLHVLDRDQVGDSKIPWELNRHQWMVGLAQADRLTGDHRYGRAAAGLLSDWLDANPPGRGLNWTSSLELALRLIAWAWVLHLLRDAEVLPPTLIGRVSASMAAHATHIERYLSRHFAPNTHLTGEGLGLLYAGVVLGDARRRARAGALLAAEGERQILADGSYFEQSTAYGRFTAELYLHALILGARNGVSFPAIVAARVQALLDQLLWLRTPAGPLPMVGDVDDGWVLPLSPREPDDPRGLFSTAAAWFGRGDYAHAAGGLAPETLWLLGPEGASAFDALEPAPPARAPSRLFGLGGIAVLRNSWASDAHQVLVDVGPLARSGHAHADLLGVACAAFGEPAIVDPGTYCYTGDPVLRDWFRGSLAHSTVTIDGAPQARAAGPFHWRSHPSARLRHWSSDAAYDLVDAEREGHRRRVLFAKPRFWVVVDDVRSGRVEVHFQFAPGFVLEPGAPWTRARTPGGRALWVGTFAGEPVRTTVRQGWVAPRYGVRLEAPTLVSCVAARSASRVVSLFIPVADGSPAPVMTLATGERGAAWDLTFAHAHGAIRIDDAKVQVHR